MAKMRVVRVQEEEWMVMLDGSGRLQKFESNLVASLDFQKLHVIRCLASVARAHAGGSPSRSRLPLRHYPSSLSPLEA